MATDFPLDGNWGEMVRILRALRIRLNGLRESWMHSDHLSNRVHEYIESQRVTLDAASKFALDNFLKAKLAPLPVDPAQERIPEMQCYFEDEKPCPTCGDTGHIQDKYSDGTYAYATGGMPVIIDCPDCKCSEGG
jgi:hypothetical protein